MDYIQAARIIRSHYGQHPSGEAPPRKEHVIDQAYVVLGLLVSEYFYALACAGRAIPRPKKNDENDEEYQLRMQELAGSDERGWREGIETPEAILTVPRKVTLLFCISTAKESSHLPPTPYPSFEVHPKDATNGRSLHVFEKLTGLVVYNAVTGKGAKAAYVGVKGSGGELSHRTIELSGWALGEGWISPHFARRAEPTGLPNPRLELRRDQKR